MKPSTRLDFCILASALMVIVCVVLLFTGCTEKQEPWTVTEQCQFYNKWAEWPEKGECQ